MGPPSKYLTKDEKRIWKELQQIAAPGVLFNCDRWTVETVCILKAKERARTITNPERAALIAIYKELGMTPVSRSRVVAAPKPKPEPSSDPWELLGSDTTIKQ
jgi:hypothetical protein